MEFSATLQKPRNVHILGTEVYNHSRTIAPEHMMRYRHIINLFICSGVHTQHHSTAPAAQVVIGQANHSAVIPAAQAGTLLLNPVICHSFF
jgi:hypothetical protein